MNTGFYEYDIEAVKGDKCKVTLWQGDKSTVVNRGTIHAYKIILEHAQSINLMEFNIRKGYICYTVAYNTHTKEYQKA